MSKNIAGSTVSALQYLERLIREQDRLNRMRFKTAREVADIKLDALTGQVNRSAEASERAVSVSRESQQVVSDKANEFRGALEDTNANNLPRAEADSRFRSMNDKLDTQAKQLEAVNLLITRFLPIADYEKGRDELRDDIRSLRESRSGSQGAGVGARELWGWIVGGISLAALIYSNFIK